MRKLTIVDSVDARRHSWMYLCMCCTSMYYLCLTATTQEKSENNNKSLKCYCTVVFKKYKEVPPFPNIRIFGVF